MVCVTLAKAVKRHGDTAVVRDVDLSLPSGQCTVLVGPSGSGKSSLLRLIAGLDMLDSGDLYFDQTRMNDVPPGQRQTAMVFQNYALYPHMTVFNNMAFALRNAKLGKAAIKTRIDQVAAMLNITSLLPRKPHALSGGQRQRVAIGRALVRQPALLLLDEPLSNLDASLRVHMRHELADLKHQLSTTMLYVTHDQVEAMTLADTLVVLRDGQVEQVGTPQTLYDNPVNTFVGGFLGSPAMNFIPAALHAQTKHSIQVKMPQQQPFTLAYTAPDLAPGTPLLLGLRPEHIMLDDLAAPHLPLQAVLSGAEYLGHESHIYADIYKSTNIVIRANSNRGLQKMQKGAQITLKTAHQHIHVFDAVRQTALKRSTL